LSKCSRLHLFTRVRISVPERPPGVDLLVQLRVVESVWDLPSLASELNDQVSMAQDGGFVAQRSFELGFTSRESMMALLKVQEIQLKLIRALEASHQDLEHWNITIENVLFDDTVELETAVESELANFKTKLEIGMKLIRKALKKIRVKDNNLVEHVTEALHGAQESSADGGATSGAGETSAVEEDTAGN
jgi:hypothetical protein